MRQNVGEAKLFHICCIPIRSAFVAIWLCLCFANEWLCFHVWAVLMYHGIKRWFRSIHYGEQRAVEILYLYTIANPDLCFWQKKAWVTDSYLSVISCILWAVWISLKGPKMEFLYKREDRGDSGNRSHIHTAIYIWNFLVDGSLGTFHLSMRRTEGPWSRENTFSSSLWIYLIVYSLNSCFPLFRDLWIVVREQVTCKVSSTINCSRTVLWLK